MIGQLNLEVRARLLTFSAGVVAERQLLHVIADRINSSMS